MKFAFLLLLTVTSTIHLIDSYKDNGKKRARTKPFLLLSIIGYYITSVEKPSWVLLVALITSWLGDVLLIPKGKKWFVCGGVSFLISHIFFIGVYSANVVFSQVNWLIVVPAILVYVTVVTIVLVKLKPYTGKMFVAMFLYLLINGTMNSFALMQLVTNPCLATAVAYAGAILFFVSDCTLYFVRFHPKKDIVFKRHFTVMLTYILGEFLITQGLIMLTL